METGFGADLRSLPSHRNDQLRRLRGSLRLAGEPSHRCRRGCHLSHGTDHGRSQAPTLRLFPFDGARRLGGGGTLESVHSGGRIRSIARTRTEMGLFSCVRRLREATDDLQKPPGNWQRVSLRPRYAHSDRKVGFRNERVGNSRIPALRAR